MADPLLKDGDASSDATAPTVAEGGGAAAAVPIEGSARTAATDGSSSAAAAAYEQQHNLYSKKDHLHEADRLITFTDAVVAIAMTLLILPLQDKASEMGDEGSEASSASEFFVQNKYRFVALAISYVVIMAYWRVHSFVFERVGRFTYWLTRLNFAWMAAVVFLPVSTQLICESKDDDAVANGTYIGNLAAIVALNLAMCLVIRNDERTWKDDRQLGIMNVADNTIGLCIIVVALLVSTLRPEVGMNSMFLLLAVAPMSRIVRMRRPDWTY